MKSCGPNASSLGAPAVLEKFDELAQAARTLLEVGLSPTTR